jgi:hypothetical protein
VIFSVQKEPSSSRLMKITLEKSNLFCSIQSLSFLISVPPT